MVKKDDNELVYEVIHGSISSFEVLIDRYQKTVFNILLRMVGDTEIAKDLTQDVFVKVYEKMGGFNFKYRFFSWIYRMSVNEAINYNRKKQKSTTLHDADSVVSEDRTDPDRESREQLLHKSIRNLEDDYRVPVLLKYFCGLSYEEIAEVTEQPVKKVRSRLYIARERLRKELNVKGFFNHD